MVLCHSHLLTCLLHTFLRQPEFAAQVVWSLEEGVDTFALHAAARCAIELTGVMGFAPPSWSDHWVLAFSQEKLKTWSLVCKVGNTKPLPGWTGGTEASCCPPQLTEADKALTQSQSGTGASVALTTTPSNLHTRVEPQLFKSSFVLPSSSSPSFFSTLLPVVVLTLLTTTMQVAVELECWGDRVLL